MILTVFTLFSLCTQDVIPHWQQAASNIMVAVGNKHINDIMEEILSKFQPGFLPHFFVVKTLANLSNANGKKIFIQRHSKYILAINKARTHARTQELFAYIHTRKSECLSKKLFRGCGDRRKPVKPVQKLGRKTFAHFHSLSIVGW